MGGCLGGIDGDGGVCGCGLCGVEGLCKGLDNDGLLVIFEWLLVGKREMGRLLQGLITCVEILLLETEVVPLTLEPFLYNSNKP